MLSEGERESPAKSFTTVRMKTRTPHADLTKTAIGYVRVSTQEQATEGVSLDAQKDRLRSYCNTNGIKLIDILADEAATRSPEMAQPEMAGPRMGTKTKERRKAN